MVVLDAQFLGFIHTGVCLLCARCFVSLRGNRFLGRGAENFHIWGYRYVDLSSIVNEMDA